MGRNEILLAGLILAAFAVALVHSADGHSSSSGVSAEQRERPTWDVEPGPVRANEIRGTARTASGEPAAAIYVHCQGIGVRPGCTSVVPTHDDDEHCLTRGAHTGRDGSFRIRDVPPGSYELWPYGRVKGKVKVDAGTDGVTLIVAPPKPLRLRLVGWTSEDRGAGALFKRVHHNDPPNVLTAGILLRIGEDGRAESRPLDSSEPYQIWVGGLANDRYAWHEGVQPGDEVIDLTVRSGGTFRGRVRSTSDRPLNRWRVSVLGPVPSLRPELHDLDNLPVTQNEAEGTFIVRGVPPGRWRLFVTGSIGDKTFDQTSWASPGDDVTITLGDE